MGLRPMLLFFIIPKSVEKQTEPEIVRYETF